MNLTIAVDDDVLLMARQRALEENTSVNAVLRRHLELYAGAGRQQSEAVARLLDISEAVQSGRGESRWTRDSLHER